MSDGKMTDDSKKLHTRKWVEKQIRDYRNLLGPENDAQDRWINDGFRNEILNLQAELAEIDLLNTPDADLLEATREANRRLRAENAALRKRLPRYNKDFEHG